MMAMRNSQFNTSSKDAMTVAPCSCTANIEYLSGIALAMSVLLCLVLSLINAINLIFGIILLSVLLIFKKCIEEKADCNLV